MKQKLTKLSGSGYEREDRCGFVLLVVFVTVLILALAAYTFTGTMTAEFQAASMSSREVSARAMAESGVEMAATQIYARIADPSIDVYHDPGMYRGQTLSTEVDENTARFSIVAPDETSTNASRIRFGMVSENARFNLNRLLEIAEDDDEETDPYEMLSYIPGMTEDIVNSMLDWVDADDEPRVGGAESSFYQSLPFPYEPANGPFTSIDELLQVQGVTPELFFGEDTNRNGLLDPNENDGSDSFPPDNADGILNPGWRAYLTVSSRERNTQPDGAEKIDVNQGLMTELFDAIEPEFDEDTAQFIVAYRLYGSNDADGATEDSLTVDQKDAAEAIGKALAGDVEGSVTRAGLDLNQVAGFSFRSLFDLIDAEVPAEVNGSPVTLQSPFSSSGISVPEFAALEQILTDTDDTYLDGRVNINEARYETLMAIPGMTETLATAIIAARPSATDQGAVQSAMANRTSAVWLLTEGLTDLETLRELGPWLTTGGDIYRFQSVGHFDRGGPTVRLEAEVDGTEDPPRITFLRDLTTLGRGFHPGLLTEAGTSN